MPYQHTRIIMLVKPGYKMFILNLEPIVGQEQTLEEYLFIQFHETQEMHNSTQMFIQIKVIEK